MSEITLFWHDYETWGIDPRRDRPSQFAGVRTNLELEIIGQPMMHYCRPTADFLPHPESVMITGITPQKAFKEGLIEADFFRLIHDELARPGTCGVGYNSLRFDDEVTRFGFYRNFLDPYAREWKNQNSRWDILDLVRMCHALRPEGIHWPKREDGFTSFRLEHLTAANNIAHEGAHDAMVDVYATIGIARLIRRYQPKLFDYYFSLRRKAAASNLLDIENGTAVLHISGMYPAEHGCIAPIIPLMQHPSNSNEIIVYDLRHDPEQLLAATPEEIAENIYTRREDMPEDIERIALKGVHVNKSPALAPLSTLSEIAAQKWQIDLKEIEQYRQRILADVTLLDRLNVLYSKSRDYSETDVDAALYDGFISNADRAKCQQVIDSTPAQLGDYQPDFSDERLNRLYFRYRARNWPETLSQEEQQKWVGFCQARLIDGDFGSTLTLEELYLTIESLLVQQQDERSMDLLKQLAAWPQQIGLA